MCNTVKHKLFNRFVKPQDGFTLVELSIVIIIVGIMSIPAFNAYTLYKRQQVVEQTEDAMREANVALGNFRAVYGRYPCPARANAVLGDADYGYEFVAAGACATVAGGVVQVNSNNATNANVMANPEIYIGTIPFRTLNMDERDAYDGARARLSYAVTGLLTDAATYANADGGISIVRDDGSGTNTDVSALTIADSAHFIVVSHGLENDGSISREGTVLGVCPAVSSTGENCDNDATFRMEEQQVSFDDSISYFVSDSIEQWQVSVADDNDIHLRRANNMAMGIAETDLTAGMYQAEIRDNAPGDAIMLVDATAAGTEGQTLVNSVCDDGDTGCFAPRLIGGDRVIDPVNNGFECPPHPVSGNPQYVVAAENGGFRCEEEIWFSCPAGEFAAGFDTNGNLICSVSPPPSCPTTNLTTTCGESRSVSASFISGNWYGYAYGGECYDLDPWTATNTADVNALPNIAAVQDYINNTTSGLNFQTRNARDCDSVQDDALTRDTFECVSGAWNPTPVRTIERHRHNNNTLGSRPPLQGGGYWRAETSGAAYNVAAPMSVDPGNGQNNHDCWCREDYYVQTQSCGGGLTGTQFRIVKQTCPQTDRHRRVQVYPASGWNTSGCSCAAGSGTDTVSCRSHFSGTPAHPQGVQGNVDIPYTLSCPGPVRVNGTPDTSDCECPVAPAGSPRLSTVACPFGFTNSFTWGGNNYVDVDLIRREDWICPTGPAPQKPINSNADGGYYTAPSVAHDPVCNCNTSMPDQPHTISCAAHPDFGPGYDGTGVHYQLAWTCPGGTYEAPDIAGGSNEVSRDCHKCKWQQGSDNGTSSTAGGTVQLGQDCPSCSGTQSCYVPLGPGSFQNYSACYCAAQP